MCIQYIILFRLTEELSQKSAAHQECVKGRKNSLANDDDNNDEEKKGMREYIYASRETTGIISPFQFSPYPYSRAFTIIQIPPRRFSCVREKPASIPLKHNHIKYTVNIP